MMKRLSLLIAATMIVAGCAQKTVTDDQFADNQQDSYGWRTISSDASASDCLLRLKKANCWMSNSDERAILKSTDTCKQVSSNNGKTTLQVLQTNYADRLVVVETKGSDRGNRPQCPTVKYTLDRSGIKEIKSIANKLFVLSKDGQVYVMYSDERFYEVLNSKKKSYNISDIRGARTQEGENHESVFLKHQGGELEINREKLAEKFSSGELRKIDFVYSLEWSSIFTDR